MLRYLIQLILKTAYDIGKANLDNIMGKLPSQEFLDKIKEIADNTPPAQEAHNIKVDYLGSYAVVTLHVKLDGSLTLDETHEIVHQVQDNIIREMPEVKYVMVHACPIGLQYDHDQEIDKIN